MNDNCTASKSGFCKYFAYILIGLSFAVGPAIAGYFISSAVMKKVNYDRFVTVKGLSEREVKSDLATWQVKFVSTGNDLAFLTQRLAEDKKKVRTFIESSGFKNEEIQPGIMRVVDLLANEYRGNNASDNRYIVEDSLTLRTVSVDGAAQLATKVSDLVNQGVVLKDLSSPTFSFTGIAGIKTEMIAEATKKAREAAEQFAKDSNSRLGGIRYANQGSISVSDLTAGSSGGDGDYSSGPSTISKKVRVVATVDYFLE